MNEGRWLVLRNVELLALECIPSAAILTLPGASEFFTNQAEVDGVAVSFKLDSHLALSEQGLWHKDNKANMQIMDRDVSSTAAHCRHMYRVKREKGLLHDQKYSGLIH